MGMIWFWCRDKDKIFASKFVCSIWWLESQGKGLRGRCVQATNWALCKPPLALQIEEILDSFRFQTPPRFPSWTDHHQFRTIAAWNWSGEATNLLEVLWLPKYWPFMVKTVISVARQIKHTISYSIGIVQLTKTKLNLTKYLPKLFSENMHRLLKLRVI